MDAIYDVIVVGGGLAGLVAARLTQRAGAHTLVLDGRPVGGRARSDGRDGFLLNRGPHALYLGGPAARVLSDLGISLAGGPPTTRAHAVRGDLVALLPAGARALATSPLLGLRGKAAIARLLTRLGRIEAGRWASVSVRQWLDGLSLPPDAEQLVEMLLRVATYGNAPEMMSADVAISQLQLALQDGVRYLDGGWQTLVDGAADGLDIQPADVQSVGEYGALRIATTVDGRELAGRAIILAPGTPTVAARLLGRAPFDVGPPVEAACLDLGVRRPSDPEALFGLDRPLYLSTHCPPAQLAPPGHAVVHVARYLAPGDDASPEVQRTELEDHARLAAIEPADIVTSRYLHRMTVVSAMATADRGGLAGRPTVTDAGIDRVLLAGDWVGPTGYLLDASIASADTAARLACARVTA